MYSMIFPEAIFSGMAVIVPFLPVFIPGVFFVKMNSPKDVVVNGAYIMLISLATTTVALLAGLLFGIAVPYTFGAFLVGGIVYASIYNRRSFTRASAWQILLVVLGVLIPVGIFMVPFLNIHDGLPTGDVQKTIIFAEEIATTHRIPDYAKSIASLNRDPVDFYTPGLHAVSALILRLSPGSLTSMGIFSLVIAVSTAWIASAIAYHLFSEKKYMAVPVVSALLVLTQFRFLRYLREPGYHFQNIVGEFFLFGLIFLFLRFIRHKKIQDSLLFFLCAVALFVSHQFSMFIAVWALLFGLLALAITQRTMIMHGLKTHRAVSYTIFTGAVLAGAIGLFLGLLDKIPALFTLHPHLTNLLPNVWDYPVVMGAIWFSAGSAGMVLLGRNAYVYAQHRTEKIVFLSISVAIFALSQGPAFGVDIPPVRALFYSVVPFSIAAAYFFVTIARVNKTMFMTSIAVTSIAVISTVSHSYGSLSHTVRTNSTLTGEQLGMIDGLAKTGTSGILIDDYNRRSASWLVSSGRPMYTRISAELQTQMKESTQSPLRKQLYLNQLDYEKIFMLGSLPEITNLLTKHDIGIVTGIRKSSESAFAHNGTLQASGIADDITTFSVKSGAKEVCEQNSECDFLLRPTTLANDIGDDEDVFEHLQASVRTARLSNPMRVYSSTFRTSNASYIPLVFNVDDYVRVLWDPENTGKPKSPLMLKIWLITPAGERLSILATNGSMVPLQNDFINSVMLTPDMATIDERGFITLMIVNPMHEMVGINLIALGL